MMQNHTKDYIEEQYHLALLDFKTAKNEDEQFAARRVLANLEKLAAEAFGFDYADSLKTKIFSMTRKPGEPPIQYEEGIEGVFLPEDFLNMTMDKVYDELHRENKSE